MTDPHASAADLPLRHPADGSSLGAEEDSGGVPLHHLAGGPPPRGGEELDAPPPPSSPELTCTRAIPRQATSRTAYTAPPPDEDDPLLAFEPYLHKAPRSNSITPARQREFVATLAATGIVQQAARRIGKSMEALYKLRARPGAEGFAAAWDEAVERGVRRLEDCALERALQGTPTPIVGRDAVIGWWDKPDNGLLRFLLQYRLPERYGVQQIKPGHPIYESIKKEVLLEFVAAHRAASEAKFEENLQGFEDNVRQFFKSRSAMRLRLEKEGDAEARLELGLPLLPEEEPKSYAALWPGSGV